MKIAKWYVTTINIGIGHDYYVERAFSYFVFFSLFISLLDLTIFLFFAAATWCNFFAFGAVWYISSEQRLSSPDAEVEFLKDEVK